jgi:isopenicillin-N epimerase
MTDLTKPAANPNLWPLDPQIVFLNHGSFGSCPRTVLEHQRVLRDRMEVRPIQYLARDLEALLDEARAQLAQFLGAKADDLVFVSNATGGINTVLRSLSFQPGDELLVTDHEYAACRNALEYVAERWRAKVVVAAVPFPIESATRAVEAVLAGVTPRTRLLLIDHVTSQTGMVMPLAQIVRELSARGVETLVDGAHAPGMLPLNLDALGAAYYTGNCHKWLCAPKAAGFLHVRRDLQKSIHPLCISHGHTSPRSDRSKFLIEFAWTGTNDPTPALCVPESLRCVGSMLPGGWPEVMARNHALALAGQKVLCDALKISAPCPDDCIGSLAAVPIPAARSDAKPGQPFFIDPLQDRLREEFNIEVPVIFWPAHPQRLLRISTQLYNSLPQVELLAKALTKLLNDEAKGR